MVQIEGFAKQAVVQGLLPDSACSPDGSVSGEWGRRVSLKAPNRSELLKFP